MSLALGAARRTARSFVFFGLAALVCACGYAGVPESQVTFDSLQHGSIVTNQFSASFGLTISADNPNRSFDIATAFDTTRTGTADYDLEGPNWSRGNLPKSTVLGRVLILAENNTDVQAPFGVLDDPDDEGNRPAGSLILDFAAPITRFGTDLLDVEDVVDENGWFAFYLAGVLQGQVNFAQLVTPGPFFDPTIQFGDRSLNRITPITAAQLNSTGFDRVVVRLGGSGAIDNLVIPEPTGAAFALAALALIGRRRRKD